MIDDPTLGVLATNLRALMAADPEHSTQAAVAKASGLDQRTVGRVLNLEHACSVTAVGRLAAVWRLEAWQLLVPNLRAADPPYLALTRSERDAWNNVRIAAETLARYRD